MKKRTLTRNNQYGQTIEIASVKKLAKKISENVIGQDAVIKSICSKIYAKWLYPEFRSNILLLGKSGTGKTAIANQISQNLQIPCIVEDATMYVDFANPGMNYSTMITNLFNKANGNPTLAANGVIFIDNIDKKIIDRNNIPLALKMNSPSGFNELTTIVKGTNVCCTKTMYINEKEEQKVISFNTSKITFVFCGEFSGLEQKDRVAPLGFAAETKTANVHNGITKTDLVRFGMPNELVSCISNIYETRDLEVDDLKNILKYSKNSEFYKYDMLFKKLRVELIYTDKLIQSIAEYVKGNFSNGAIELNLIVSHIFENIMWDIIGGQAGNYKKCILDDRIVFDNSCYSWQ